jgi:hypothetical protein
MLPISQHYLAQVVRAGRGLVSFLPLLHTNKLVILSMKPLSCSGMCSSLFNVVIVNICWIYV